MIKNILALVALVLFSFPAYALNGNITIGKKSANIVNNSDPDSVITNFGNIGLGVLIDDDYYHISFSKVNTGTSRKTEIHGLQLYIPKELFVNGSYDLEILPESAFNSSLSECADTTDIFEDGEALITLPSRNKIYITSQYVNTKKKGKFFRSKGLTVDKLNSGFKINIEVYQDSLDRTFLNADLKGKALVNSYKSKQFISDNCELAKKKSKTKLIGKKQLDFDSSFVDLPVPIVDF